MTKSDVTSYDEPPQLLEEWCYAACSWKSACLAGQWKRLLSASRGTMSTISLPPCPGAAPVRPLRATHAPPGVCRQVVTLSQWGSTRWPPTRGQA